VVTTLKILILLIIPPGEFISEDLEEEWTVVDSESSSSSENAPQTQKSAPTYLLTPRATPNTPGPIESSESSEQSREIRGDITETNIIVNSRAQKPIIKAN
jgi:hypothetical protein